MTEKIFVKIEVTAFTVESYDKGLSESNPIHKIGRNNNYGTIGVEEGYEGGAVFRTREEAQAFIDKNKYSYSVYGLILPNKWEIDVDTSKHEEEGFNRLINDAMVVGLE
jgi:hypothetical protein